MKNSDRIYQQAYKPCLLAVKLFLALMLIAVLLLCSGCALYSHKVQRSGIRVEQARQALAYGIAQENEYQESGDPDNLIKEVKLPDGTFQKVYKGEIINYGRSRRMVKITEFNTGLDIHTHSVGGGVRLPDLYLPPGMYLGSSYRGDNRRGTHIFEVDPRKILSLDGRKVYWFLEVSADYY